LAPSVTETPSATEAPLSVTEVPPSASALGPPGATSADSDVHPTEPNAVA